MQANNLILILICLNILFFLCGFIIGKLTNSRGVYTNESSSILNRSLKKDLDQKITIDNTKIVTEIKTDDLEKKYNQLGTKTQSDQQISSAINKLKNMKG